VYFADLTTGQMRAATTGALPFMRLGTDGSFALVEKAHPHSLFGVSASGVAGVGLSDTATVTSIAMLEGRRFAFVSHLRELKVASYPTMMTHALIPATVGAVYRGSPDGAHLMFRLAPLRSGLADLYMVATSSASLPTVVQLSIGSSRGAFPAGDPFSADSQYAYWYDRVDSNSIGTAFSRKADGSGMSQSLATGSIVLRNIADPTSVMIFDNARLVLDPASQMMVVGVVDMTVQKRDGSSGRNVIVPDIDPGDWILFPTSRSKIAYHVDMGSNLGIWVRDLPSQ
jgi:hypothetical protein